MIVSKYDRETAVGQGLGFFCISVDRNPLLIYRRGTTCGEGACSRSAAKQSLILLARFAWESAGGRFATQREQAPSPQGIAVTQ